MCHFYFVVSESTLILTPTHLFLQQKAHTIESMTSKAKSMLWMITNSRVVMPFFVCRFSTKSLASSRPATEATEDPFCRLCSSNSLHKVSRLIWPSTNVEFNRFIIFVLSCCELSLY